MADTGVYQAPMYCVSKRSMIIDIMEEVENFPGFDKRQLVIAW